jgi:hypothetical protein
MRNGCMTYLANVIDSEKDNVELSNVPIRKEFSGVFLEELLGLSLKREVEVFKA